jgi:hypothetical protein
MKIRYLISEKWSKAEIIEVMEAVEFAIKYYKLENNKATLTVKLQTGMLEDAEADADKLKNNRYEIRLNKSRLASDKILPSIFHEMTHVKQFMFDRLNMRGNCASWRGETYPTDSPAAYFLSPWEMEARAMEEALLFFYLEEHK